MIPSLDDTVNQDNGVLTVEHKNPVETETNRTVSWADIARPNAKPMGRQTTNGSAPSSIQNSRTTVPKTTDNS